MNIFEFTRRLIDIPSISGDELEVGNFIAEHLADTGYNVELQEVQPGRSNVFATTNAQPRIVLSTHMDTVPAFIPSSEDEQFIYGRGACDAKGIIAAQIEAAKRLRQSGYEEIGLLFTVDEELGSLGARAVNNHPLASQCDYLINGEPTDNLLAVGSKGSLRARIRTEGKAAHSAYPEAGESAIDKLLNALERIRQTKWPVDQFFGETTCNIGVLQGGTRPNVIAAEAHADIQIRLVAPSLTTKSLLERAVSDSGTVEYLSIAEPVKMHSVSGLEQTVVRFTTDLPYLSNWGRPLLLGPGSILVAHTDVERVSKQELTESVVLYMQLVEKLTAS